MRNVLIFAFVLFSWSTYSQSKPSLDEMISQMVMVGLNDFDNPDRKKETLELISEGKIGGIILFEKDLKQENTLRELKDLVLSLQRGAQVPMFMCIDEEGGRVNRLKPKYGFPKSVSAQYLGEVDKVDSTLHYGRSTAKNLQEYGFNVNFAPTVDVNINPDNPVISKAGRSYSSDHRKVTLHAGKFIEAHDAYNVATVLKHFPGHGSSAADTHHGVADVSNSWVIEELYPYQNLIKNGNVKAIMTAHIVNRSLDEKLLPATLSKKVMTDMLRGMLGFEGVVFSDDMHMAAISKEYGFQEAVVLAINAGVDVLIFSNNVFDDERTDGNSLHGMIKKQVEAGNVELSRVEESYERIMNLKKSLGLLEPDYFNTLSIKLNGLN